MSEGKEPDDHNEKEEEALLDAHYQTTWAPDWLNTGKYRNWIRLIVCGFGIGLIWLTSLQLATAVAGLYVSAPSYDSSVAQWEFVFDLADNERILAAACVGREMVKCYWELNQTYLQLQALYNATVQYNNATLAAEKARNNYCSERHDNSVVAVGTYLSKNITLSNPDIYNSNCSAAQISQLRSYLGYTSTQKSALYSQNANYATTTNTLFSVAEASAQNRTTYDYNYFLNPPNGKFSVLTEAVESAQGIPAPYIPSINADLSGIRLGVLEFSYCIGLQDGNLCDITPNAYSIYQKMATAVNTTAETLFNTFDTVLSEAQTYYSEAENYISQAEALFNTLSAVASGIDSVVGQGFDLLAEIPFNGFRRPNFTIPLPGLPGVPSPTALFQELKSFQTNIDLDINASIASVNVQLDDLVTNLNLALDPIPCLIFCDYNPPPIVIPIDAQLAATESFLETSAAAIGGFVGQAESGLESVAAAFSNASLDLPFSFSLTSDFHLLVADFYWEFSFDNLLSSIGDIIYLLIVADILYRVVSSFVYVYKYWAISDMGLPVIEAQSFQAKKIGWQFNAVYWFQFFTSPMALLPVFLIIGILALLALLSAYLPLYQSYQAACVHGTTNGTLLTRNAYSFAYNFAATEYNEVVAKDLSQYDQTRSAYCATYGQASVQLEVQSNQTQTTYQNDYDLWAEQMALFDLCINASSPYFPNYVELKIAQPNITAYPYDPTEYAERLNCSIPGAYGPSIENVTFDCSLLPACDLPCVGPDSAALRAATFESGCQSEWMFHAGLFRYALALLVYACLNVSRILIITATVRLCWRSLSKHGFEFKGSVDRMGRITKETQEMIKVKTDAAIKKFESVAWLMMAGAVLVHIPYIAVLASYGRTFNASTTDHADN